LQKDHQVCFRLNVDHHTFSKLRVANTGTNSKIIIYHTAILFSAKKMKYRKGIKVEDVRLEVSGVRCQGKKSWRF
jgi:hypothetical protein